GDRPVERERAERIPPARETPSPAGLHRVERDQAERVVAEVQDQVGEEDEGGAESNAADQHGSHQPGGAAPCWRSTSSMIIVLRPSSSLTRSVRPSFLISSRIRGGGAGRIMSGVATALASS